MSGVMLGRVSTSAEDDTIFFMHSRERRGERCDEYAKPVLDLGEGSIFHRVARGLWSDACESV